MHECQLKEYYPSNRTPKLVCHQFSGSGHLLCVTDRHFGVVTFTVTFVYLGVYYGIICHSISTMHCFSN